MSEVSIFSGRLPEAPALPFTKAGRTMARIDAAATIQAREDLNEARLAAHRAQLDAVVEKAKADGRADVMEHVMTKAREVHQIAVALAGGSPSLALTLAELQNAYNTGEVVRAIKRGTAP